MSSETPLLDPIACPQDLRTLDQDYLPALADELRSEVINTVSKTGGHLGANLGVIELTLSLHYVFNTPHDRLIFDVGHQSYPHKILTGRRKAMLNLRQGGGLSGFTKRQESPYDPFGAGHSSTSLSAGLGMLIASQLAGLKRHVITVIGDGAMSAGMAYEAMNNAGALGSPMLVVLNDNAMSIAPPVGAMSAYLSRLLSSHSYMSFRSTVGRALDHLPESIGRLTRLSEGLVRGVDTGGTLFEELGFYYVGPVDGHNFQHLLPVLQNIRDSAQHRPTLLHVLTQKGKGYALAEEAEDKYHGVSAFDPKKGVKPPPPSKEVSSYTDVFASTLCSLAEGDERIVAITAAMPSGTGVGQFQKRFPKRAFDTGIAEQHAVTFAAGLAAEGYKPFVAIYSTFLQRAYDQVVHDVVLQSLPVRFILDRAGYVGPDGATHCGAFDLVFLCCLPGMVVMAPSDEHELAHMIVTAAHLDDAPSAIRYPKAQGRKAPPLPLAPLEIGKGRVVCQGNSLAVLSLGTPLSSCLEAEKTLREEDGISITIADARFAKPLDDTLVRDLARQHKALIIVEEGAMGGFSSYVTRLLLQEDWTHKLTVRSLTMPDAFFAQDTRDRQLKKAHLDHASLVALVRELLREEKTNS